jgi:tetratricopeptide (TPR) repeat protein
LQQAEQLCREVAAQNQDVNQIFQAYETLGRIYQRRGDFDAAMAAFSDFENKFKYPRVKALAMLGRASTMLAQNKRDEALAYYRQAMEACNEPMDCCRITCERAQHLITAGRREEVRQVYLTVRNTLPNCWCHDEAVRFLQQQ